MLDLMTTIAFLVNGIQEANPLVRLVLSRAPNPVSGLLLIKVLAVVLAVYCWRVGRTRLLSRMNVLFAIVVVWNLIALIVGSVHNV